jgi:hypothetical protein
MMYNNSMLTIVETPIYLKHVQAFWTVSERENFVVWMADNPESGDVIPNNARPSKGALCPSGYG